MMKSIKIFSARLGILLVLILVLCICTAAAESYDAGTMRLLRYEGDVVIEDVNGDPRFVMENVRFASGEAMFTGTGALASVGLDDDKAVTLDENSRVQFLKGNNQIRMTLTDGTLFLDVQKKLDENEEVDIETSTMVVGIRGTIVALSDFPVGSEEAAVNAPLAGSQTVLKEAAGAGSAANGVGGAAGSSADLSSESAAAPSAKGFDEILNTDVIGAVHGRVSVLCVLEGVATVTYRDTEGVLHTIQVRAGEKAILTDRLGDGQADENVVVQELYREDLEKVVIQQVESDSTLKSRVENASDVLTKSNPVYSNPVALTSGSATKSFDGEGFDAQDLAVTVEGLPDGFYCTAVSSGNRADVGGSENAITEYAIYDDHGLNVTKRFKNLIVENGTLAVTWDDPVTLVAQSASKMYNGEPLRRTTDVLVDGLPSEYSIRVFADGSQTDAGTSSNPISSYTIYNSEGTDVTEYFTNIQTVPGQLVVDPAPLTVWTGSAQKVYDGTPLTNNNARVTTAPGYDSDMPLWRNLSYVFSDVSPENGVNSDCQALYGVSGVVWVHGTNPLTGEIREIELHAGQKLLVYLHDEENVQSIEFKLEDVSELDLPEEILRLFADNRDLLQQSCADTAWDPDVIEALIDALPEQTETEPLVEEAGLKIAESEAEHLMTDFTNVRITIDTEITDYTDRALGQEEAHYTRIILDETITVKATGSQTEIGESWNTYTISWGNAKSKNYSLNEDLGILKVTGLPEADTVITLTAASAKKTYDGTPLEDSSVSATGLPEGYSVVASATGSQKDAGSGSNKVAEYKILNAAGTDVTDLFSITTVDGTLTVQPAAAEVSTGSDEKVYDGTALSCPDAGINGLVNGETATVKATGTITEPGEVTNGYEISWGSANPDNYILTENLGVLKVTEFTGGDTPITLTAASAEKTYDGTPLEDSSVSAAGLPEGYHVVASAAGSRKDAGSGSNKVTEYKILNAAGTDVTDLFSSITTVDGTLTVQPAAAEVSTGSDEKVYDGTALSCPDAGITGLVNGETATVKATGTITEPGESTNSYEISWGSANPDNYILSENPGTLKVMKLELALSLENLNVEYSGSPAVPIPTLTYANGSHAGESVSGMRLRSMNVLFRFSLFTEDSMDLSITGMEAGAGTYNLETAMTFPEGAEGRYTTSIAGGATMTVNPAILTITTGPATKVYDSKALTCSDTSVEGLVNGETVTVTATGTVTDCGTAANGYTIEWGDTNKDNYTITEKLGVLEVTPLEILIDMNNCEAAFTEYGAEYDASPWCYWFDDEDGAYAVYANGPDKGTALAPSDISYDEGTYAETASYDLPGDGEATVTLNSCIDAGSYTVVPVIAVTAGKKENYSFSYTDNTLVIAPLSVIFDLNGGEYYSTTFTNLMHLPHGITAFRETTDETLERTVGKRVYNSTYTKLLYYLAEFNLLESDTVQLQCKGPVTVDDEQKFTYTYTFTGKNENNYQFSSINEGITINPLYVNLYLRSYEDAVYDGKFHGADPYVGGYYWMTPAESSENTWNLTGSIKKEPLFQVTITGGGTDACTYVPDGDREPYQLEYEITYPTVSKDNFVIYVYNDTFFIDPAPLYITTGSASKVYDGTPLTCDDTEIEGLVGDDVITVATASITDAGEADNDFSIDWGTTNENNYVITDDSVDIGTLTVTPRDVEFDLGGTVVGYDGEFHGGDLFVYCEGLDTTVVRQEGGDASWIVTFDSGDTAGVTIVGGGTTPGDYTLECKYEFTAGSEDNFSISCVYDTLTISSDPQPSPSPEPLAVTTGSAAKVYDGTPLVCPEVTVEGLRHRDSITVTATGSRTEVGVSDNIYQIDWGETDPNNYDLENHLGRLEVVSPDTPITIAAGSASKTYDGTALTCDEVTITGLPDGFTCTCSISGSQTVAGESANTISGYTIQDMNNQDVTDAFTAVTTVDGTLTVDKNNTKITITAGSFDREYSTLYDGRANSYTVEGLPEGHSVDAQVEGCQYLPGTSDNVITDYTIRNSNGEDVTACFDNVECVKGTLHVTKAGVYCWTTGSTKTYDGDTLSTYTFYWTGIKNSDNPISGVRHELTSNASIKDVGSVEIQFIAYLREDLNDKYEITSVSYGSNTVEPAPLTVVTDSGTKPYDGTPLTAGAHLEGLMSCDDATVVATGTIINEGQTTNTYKINWGTTNPENYTITEKLGTLTITGAKGGSGPADTGSGKSASRSLPPDFESSSEPENEAPTGSAAEPESEVPAGSAAEPKSEVPAASAAEPENEVPAAPAAEPKSEVPAGSAAEPEADPKTESETPAATEKSEPVSEQESDPIPSAEPETPAAENPVQLPEPKEEPSADPAETNASGSAAGPESEVPAGSAAEPEADPETESDTAAAEEKSESVPEQESDPIPSAEPETPAAENPVQLPEPKDESSADPAEINTSVQESPAGEEEPAAAADLNENTHP